MVPACNGREAAFQPRKRGIRTGIPSTKSPTPNRRSRTGSKASSTKARLSVSKQPWTSPTTGPDPRGSAARRGARCRTKRSPQQVPHLSKSIADGELPRRSALHTLAGLTARSAHLQTASLRSRRPRPAPRRQDTARECHSPLLASSRDRSSTTTNTRTASRDFPQRPRMRNFRMLRNPRQARQQQQSSELLCF